MMKIAPAKADINNNIVPDRSRPAGAFDARRTASSPALAKADYTLAGNWRAFVETRGPTPGRSCDMASTPIMVATAVAINIDE
jgi:hypothetical protein